MEESLTEEDDAAISFSACDFLSDSDSSEWKDTSRLSTAAPCIDDKRAVCCYCAFISDDFNRCTRCKRFLPENVKIIDYASVVKKRKPGVKKQQRSHKNIRKQPYRRHTKRKTNVLVMPEANTQEEMKPIKIIPLNISLVQPIEDSPTSMPIARLSVDTTQTNQINQIFVVNLPNDTIDSIPPIATDLSTDLTTDDRLIGTDIKSDESTSDTSIDHKDIVTSTKGVDSSISFDARHSLNMLRCALKRLIVDKTMKRIPKFNGTITADQDHQPVLWVAKWVDYSVSYGFGYQLSNEYVGVSFNDNTKFIIHPDGTCIKYINTDGNVSCLTRDQLLKRLGKKCKALFYTRRSLQKMNSVTGCLRLRQNDTLVLTPYLHQWCTSPTDVLMQLTNGIVQINFIDNIKLIMCPYTATVTYTENDKDLYTFRFATLKRHGCAELLYDKLTYAYHKISMLYHNVHVDKRIVLV